MVIDVLTVDITQNDTTICAGDSLVLLTNASQSYPSNSSNLQINNSDLVIIDNQSFNFTGADQSYTIPANSNLLHVKMWGAGGGKGTTSSGGAGGYTESYIEIPNTSNFLTLIVGEGGSGGTNINDTYGGGGGSGDDGNSSGGQGGGRSAIAFDGNYILVAGGGGGGGYNASDKNGGQGGGLVGGDGYSSATAGFGATQSSVGIGGGLLILGYERIGEDGGVGNQWQGGRGSISGTGWGGGGGGGGYFGGGGGGGSNADHGGGGGGSGFAGRDGQSFLIGADYGSVASYLDANGRMDVITLVKYFNTKVLGGDNNTEYPLVQNANYGKGGNSSNAGNGFIEIIAYRTDLNDYTYSWQPGGETTTSITVQPNATTTYTLDVTSGTTTCQSDVTVTANPQEDATFTYSASSYCADDSDPNPVNPTPTISGTIGGVFSSTAGLSINSSTGQVDLDASTPGTYTITYSTPGANCSATSTQDVTITTPSTDFNYGGDTEFCLGTTNPVATITGASGGTFSATGGLTIDASTGQIDLSTAIAGNYQVTYTSASSGNFQQIGQDIDGEAAGDESGRSVSMNAAGDRLAIGARNNDGNGSNAGHVRIYDWNGTAWIQLGHDIDGEAAGDESGWSVSMNAAGDRLAIGARNNDGNGSNAGHVRIYDWNGTAWIQLGTDIDGEAAGDVSGWSVSMNAAGDRLAIGALNNDGNGSNAGHVRIYDWNGTAWTQLGADIDGEAADDQVATLFL